MTARNPLADPRPGDLLRITRRMRVRAEAVGDGDVRVTVSRILYWPSVCVWVHSAERWTLNEYRQTAAGEKVRVLETAP